MIRHIFSVGMVLGLFVCGQHLLADEWKAPEDFEKAQARAEEAVRSIDPDAHYSVDIESSAVGISPLITDVGGIKANVQELGSRLDADIVSVDQAISDLDAKTTEFAIVVDLKSDVLFVFDKSDIKPDAVAILDKVAAIIKGKNKGNVLIEGHTDSKGSSEYNQKLSERRAKAVRDWLAKHYAIEPERMVTRGWGETKPVAPNTKKDGSDNPEGRAKNRRVVITIPTVE